MSKNVVAVLERSGGVEDGRIPVYIGATKGSSVKTVLATLNKGNIVARGANGHVGGFLRKHGDECVNKSIEYTVLAFIQYLETTTLERE